MVNAKSKRLKPLDSISRLEALKRTGLMDSSPQVAFDRAVRLAKRILSSDVALFSLVDDKRQFFVAQIGLAEPYATVRQTPLYQSVCQYVVTHDEPLTVSDAREVAFLRENLAVTDMNVVAYLGVPVRAPEGDVLGSFCAIQSTPRDWTEDERTVLVDIAATVESEIKLRSLLKEREAEIRVAASTRDRLNLALKSGALGTYDLDLITQESRWDSELYEIWGLPNGIENPFERAIAKIHPEDVAIHKTAFATCLNPEGDRQYDAEFRIILEEHKSIRWVSSTGIVEFDDDGNPARMVGTAKDVSAQKKAEHHALLLAQELNHRVKNLFSITNGLISITARESNSIQEMQNALRARIVSLSAAHDLVRPAITQEPHDERVTDLETLGATILGPHKRHSDQISLTGPTLILTPQTSSSLALVLHELATNAGKYGALTDREGCVTLTWTLEKDNLSITWAERGGPAVDVSKAQNGFGSTLIDLTVRRQMYGDYEMCWDVRGLTCHIHIPWSHHEAEV